jgi:hypothetical protein
MKPRDRRASFAGRVLRPLDLVGAVAATVLAFALLFPLAERREQEVRETPPDLVSLSYLRLSLERQPDDRTLRTRVAGRLLAAGLFDEARAVSAPLAGSDDPDAAQLAVEIDFQHWLATRSERAELRKALLERARAGIQRLIGTDLDLPTRERLAEICVVTGQLGLRARLWTEAALRALDPVSVERADAAQLEVGDPLGAARLWSALAMEVQGPRAVEYARRALERARSADQPAAALALFEELVPRVGADPELLALGVAISAGLDDRRALALAEQLLDQRPDDVALQRQVAELAVWTGRPASIAGRRAVPDREAELAAARANWDLERLLELARKPEQRSELIERVSLLEATGRVPEALATLSDARATNFADDPEVWGRQLALQLAAGQIEEGLATLERMEGRFGLKRATAYRRSELLLSLGRAREALDLLLRLPLAGDAVHARNVRRLAWELGDLAVVRRALATLTASSEAQAWDFEQLWLVDYEAQHFQAALATARQGYARFETEALLSLSVDAAQAAHDDAALSSLLGLAEARGSGRRSQPGFWTLRAQLEQLRARAAWDRGDRAVAEQSSAELRQLLARARALAPNGESAYAEIERADQRRALALALEGDDLPAVAALYASQEQSLTSRERVQVLARLGRYEEAVSVAMAELNGQQESPEHDALEADARTLTQDLPRQLWLHGDALQIPELFSLTLAGGIEYAFSPELRLAATAELTRFDGPGGASFGAELPWSAEDRALEVSARLRAALGGTVFSLGIAAWPDGKVRPFGSFEQRLLERVRQHLSVLARVNERSLETAFLRRSGAEDQLTIGAQIGLSDELYLSGNAAGQAYWDLDRKYVGSGATLNAGAGYNLALGPRWGSANLRLSSYLAPRFAADPSAGFVPDGTSWVGVGGSWSRGRLDAPPVSGRSLALLTDATLGWLVPQRELGWSGQLGVGVSLLGADLLSVSARASNVLGTTPGFAAYGVGAEYRMSEWE